MWFAYYNTFTLIFSLLEFENGLKKHIKSVTEIKYGFVKVVVTFVHSTRELKNHKVDLNRVILKLCCIFIEGLIFWQDDLLNSAGIYVSRLSCQVLEKGGESNPPTLKNSLRGFFY